MCLGIVGMSIFPDVLWSPIFVKKDTTIRMLHVGDMMFDRGVRVAMAKGYDPFAGLRESGLVKGMHVVLGNLEGPIVEMPREKCQQKAYNFQFASTTGDMLRRAGFTMVTVANNHIFDCYRAGVQSTNAYLASSSITVIGNTPVESSYVIKEIQGKTFAFVGIDQTIAPVPVAKYYPLVKKLDGEVDMVIVHIHWGLEYRPTPDRLTQEVFARALIDHGADVIIGHHPHVIQSMDIYKNTPIFYSLGNFIFDQNTIETNKGIAVSMEIGDEVSYQIHPYVIEKSVPRFVSAEESEVFCQTFIPVVQKGCRFTIHSQGSIPVN